MSGSSLPTWIRPSQAVTLVLNGATVRTCLPVAAVVGTVLTTVNQGTVLLTGHLSVATVARVAANYAIPFCVSSYGALIAVRGPQPSEPAELPEQGGHPAEHSAAPES